MAGRMRIGEMMLRAGLIDELQLNAALAHQRQWGGKIGAVMVELGFVDEDLLWKGLAKQTGLTRAELPSLQFSPALLQRIPVDLLERHTVFPVAYRDDSKTLTVATADPSNMRAMDELAFRTSWKVNPVLSPETEIQWAIRYYYKGDHSPCPPLRKKAAPVAAPSQEDEEEFKVTDISGKTVMKKISDIAPPPQPAPPPAPPPPPPGAAPRFGQPMSLAAGAAFGNPASVAAMPPGTELPPEALALKTELEKGNKLLKSLVEMCIARGIFTQQEYIDRLNRR